MNIVQLFEQPGSISVFILGVLAGFLLSWIISFFKGKSARAKNSNKASPLPSVQGAANPAAGASGSAVIAAITAAVNEYRKNYQQINS